MTTPEQQRALFISAIAGHLMLDLEQTHGPECRFSLHEDGTLVVVARGQWAREFVAALDADGGTEWDDNPVDTSELVDRIRRREA